jgi:synaptobrevin homolog YKT6
VRNFSPQKVQAMQVVAIILYKWKPEHPVEVSSHLDLTKFGYFQRKAVREFIKFHSRVVVGRTAKGQRQSVTVEQNVGKCHVFVNPNGLAGAVLADAEYPMRVAYSLLNEAMRQFEAKQGGKWASIEQDAELDFPEGAELLAKYQDPTEADKISKIEKELDDVKGIVTKSMNDILQRGEALETLMQKSEDLSQVSYQFYRTAKKNNQCCQAGG